eukprot:UN2554
MILLHLLLVLLLLLFLLRLILFLLAVLFVFFVLVLIFFLLLLVVSLSLILVIVLGHVCQLGVFVRLQIAKAPLVPLHLLVGGENHALLVLAVFPAVWGIAGVFRQQLENVPSVQVELSRQALVNKQVLAPQARAGAKVVKVDEAALRPIAPGPNCVARENLQGSVHTKLAVVEVNSIFGVFNVL